MHRRLRRSINALRLRRAMARERTRLPGLPRYLMVEPTNRCNLSCPLCPTGSGTLRAPRGEMAFDDYARLIEELSPALETILLWGFGEPLLHPDIVRMVGRAHSLGIVTKISTNGQCFGERDRCRELVASGLDQLRISLDGLSDETLRVYRRGASFDAILEGISWIQEAKRRSGRRTPLILLQFIVMEHNRHEKGKLAALAEELGVAWRFKSVSIGEHEDDGAGRFLPDGEEHRYIVHRCADGRSDLRPKEARPRLCPYPWLWAHVSWDGTIVPCCKDPHREHPLGNAFGPGGFRRAWNGPAFVEFRKRYLEDPAALERCRRCDYPFSQCRR